MSGSNTVFNSAAATSTLTTFRHLQDNLQDLFAIVKKLNSVLSLLIKTQTVIMLVLAAKLLKYRNYALTILSLGNNFYNVDSKNQCRGSTN